MRPLIFTLSAALLTMVFAACKTDAPDIVSIRLLPCDLIDSSDQPGEKPHLMRLYAVTTKKDTADKALLHIIDSFTCNVLDTIDIKNYRGVVIDFLKETERTKKLQNSEVTDTHNPYGSDHETLIKYIWGNGTFIYRAWNSHHNNRFSPPCLTSSSP